AAHLQAFELGAEGDLGFVPRPAAAGDQLVARHALARAGRGREPQVQVAAPGGELAQGANGDGVRHRAMVGDARTSSALFVASPTDHTRAVRKLFFARTSLWMVPAQPAGYPQGQAQDEC